MTTNKYATLRGTIARAKRNDCQKVVMRVTLVEELLLQLSNAEKQIAELATENAWLKQFPDQIVGFIGKLGSSEIGSETKEKIEAAAKKIKTPATDAFLAEVRAQGVDAAIEAAKNLVAQEYECKDFKAAQSDCCMHPGSDLVGKVEMTEWLVDFAAQLRKGGSQ
ncbi:TPA: hypothetical protein ACW7WN_002971 [Enterobacter cloacae]|uniref:hypothetical protein n=1 Tax=Enterobacter TaxID=547 RepID=UPI00079315DF|nr:MULTISPECIES: hypothetical protein [Enterobacter]SAE09927.1 Uncharacterised protein [Enterobacter roggenkampii]